jgi:hypothetical protein
VVVDPAGLVRLGALGEAVPVAPGAAPGAASSFTPTATPQALASAGLDDPFAELDGGWLGVAGLGLASGGSLLLTALRRRRADRRLASMVTKRFAGLRRPSGSA